MAEGKIHSSLRYRATRHSKGTAQGSESDAVAFTHLLFVIFIMVCSTSYPHPSALLDLHILQGCSRVIQMAEQKVSEN